MSSFLEHVAEDLLKRFGENLSRVAVGLSGTKGGKAYLESGLYHHQRTLP